MGKMPGVLTNVYENTRFLRDPKILPAYLCSGSEAGPDAKEAEKIGTQENEWKH
jgi:hypothetical protein